jgi:predicted nucleic acid-binding Zn ribbon protein
MIKTQVLCDVCMQPMPEDENNIIHLYRTKECDTRSLYPYLCKSCAEKIDAALRKFKDDTQHEKELAAKFAKANAERKKQLGTKG